MHPIGRRIGALCGWREDEKEGKWAKFKSLAWKILILLTAAALLFYFSRPSGSPQPRERVPRSPVVQGGGAPAEKSLDELLKEARAMRTDLPRRVSGTSSILDVPSFGDLSPET